MRKGRGLLVVCVVVGCLCFSTAQTAKTANHMVPTGKGWGVQAPATANGSMIPEAVVTGNGINYHGGKIMAGHVNVYFLWYGNWTNGPKASDRPLTVSLLSALYGSTGGLGGSPYMMINSTYGDTAHNVSGAVSLVQSATDNYSKGKRLTDLAIKNVVSSAISSGKLPKDTNGIYFVLTSSDVTATSGFCTQYCGWHSHGTILSADIKYSFVGNPDRCPNACEAQTTSPNGDSGADGMASIMAHETEEAISDPDLNAWFDTSGAENADKCAWKFGPLKGTLGHGASNMTLGTHTWLIQMNWENARKGGCDQKKGGTFYNF
jgi:hypothetical protein